MNIVLLSFIQDYQTLLFILCVSLIFQVIILLKSFKKIEPVIYSFLDKEQEITEPQPKLQKSKSFEEKFYEEENIISEDLKDIDKSKFFLNADQR